MRNRLKQIALGNVDEARKELPDLLVEFPDDAGVKLLHAVLVEDAKKALPLFIKIVEIYPESEWADDAQWRIVQIFALRRDTAHAREELQIFREHYPDSEFLLSASQTVKAMVGSPPMKILPKTETKITPTPIKNTTKVTAPPPSSSKKEATPKETTPKTPTKTEKPKKETVEIDPNEPADDADDVPASKTPKKDTNIGTKSKNSTVETPNPKKSDKKTDGKFGFQVGLYKTKKAAQDEVERFTKERLRAEIIEKKVDDNIHFAVIVGEYPSKDSAEKAKSTVEKICRCVPFVMEK